MTTKSLTSIILAGGKSTRFKSPKYLAKIGGKSLLEIAIAKLEPLCQEIIVVSKETPQIATPRQVGARNGVIDGGPSRMLGINSATRQSPVNYILEQDKNYHPLIGIKEGLRASKNEANLVLACDMPFVSQKTLLRLVPSPLRGEGKGGGESSENTLPLIPSPQGRGDNIEVRIYRYKGCVGPLLGFYRKSCLKKISNFDFHISNLKMIEALAKCNIDYIDVTKDCLDFFNINTKEDLIEAQKIAQKNPQLLGN